MERKYMEEIIRIRERGTITIPQSLRNELGMEDGDYVRIVSREKEDLIIIEKVEIMKSKSKKQNGIKT